MNTVTLLENYPKVMRIVLIIKRCIDILFTMMAIPFCVFAGALLRFVPGNTAYPVFNKFGFHFIKHGYEAPIPDELELNEAFGKDMTQLVGIEINDKNVLSLLEDVFPCYLDEFRKTFKMYRSSSNPMEICVVNGTFMAVDAHIYWCFIRHYKPSRIIEIGAGNSTLLAARASIHNYDSDQRKTEVIAIDPSPPSAFRKDIPGLSQLLINKVQNVDINLITSLAPGDILFIDSSHVLRSGNDVHLEICELLPRLQSGVLVHFHDISLPKPYPYIYFKTRHYYNEQYLLQAFLMFNTKYEVIWPSNYMMVKYPERMAAMFPEYNVMRQTYKCAEAGSFWMRVK